MHEEEVTQWFEELARLGESGDDDEDDEDDGHGDTESEEGLAATAAGLRQVGGVGSDGDTVDDAVQMRNAASFQYQQQQQVLLPVVPNASASVGDASVVGRPRHGSGDVLMSTEQ